jgi:hypothetical protein
MGTKIGIGDILVLDFWKILKTGNFQEFGFSEEQWNDLYDDYFKLKNDPKSKIFLKNLKEEALVVFKMELVKEVYNFLLFTIRQKPFFLNLYNDRIEQVYKCAEDNLKIKIQRTQPETYNLKQIERVYSALYNKYNIMQGNKQKQVNKEVQNIYKIVANVSGVIGMQLNVKEMTLEEWMAYEEMANVKIKNQKDGRPIS